MPELPDLAVYIQAMDALLAGRRLTEVRLLSPFVLRSVDPPIESVRGHMLRHVSRIGKRLVLELVPADTTADRMSSRADDGLFLVIHLMIAGRLRWRLPGQKPGVAPRQILAALVFEHGTLFFTEASSKKRASLQLVRGWRAVDALNPGGAEPLEVSAEQFRDVLMRENHTLKRTLTDPHLFSGIGNAYSDEILHAARLSPLARSRALSDSDVLRLYEATRATLAAWVERLTADAAGTFPEKVSAFRDAMAVHGRFKLPCPVCRAPVQRIRYAANECNYCARCQTGGRLLADRSLSRLLKDDWPKWLES